MVPPFCCPNRAVTESFLYLFQLRFWSFFVCFPLHRNKIISIYSQLDVWAFLCCKLAKTFKLYILEHTCVYTFIHANLYLLRLYASFAQMHNTQQVKNHSSDLIKNVLRFLQLNLFTFIHRMGKYYILRIYFAAYFSSSSKQFLHKYSQ